MRAKADGSPSGLPRRLAPLYVSLLAGNAAAWAWALTVGRGDPVFLGASVLAYAFGLRHAVDADHIAAIDNVTRRLMQQGQKPLTVGLYFSLGHSSVVALACAGVAAASQALSARFAGLRDVGGLIGTGVSAGFLFLIALANLASLASLIRSWRASKRGEAAVEPAPLQGGLLGRIVGPLTAFIRRPWRMYLLGFLFGLGFDTATEVGLLGLSARQAAASAPVWSIMVFPALFTAAMSLVDTTDGVLMVGAYGWAFDKPRRKLAYNLAVTAVSVATALVVGAIEVAGLIGDHLSLAGGAWRWIGAINAHFSLAGAGVVALFLALWAGSALTARRRA